jgi:hypothetical protein
MILETIFISSVVALVLIIWFHTEAFLEYAGLIGGSRFFHIDDFRKEQAKIEYPAPHMDFIQYLLNYRDSFFVRLITCPICLSFWLTVIVCFASGLWVLLPASNLLALVVYKLMVKIMDW